MKMRPPLTRLFILLMFIPLGMLSEKSAMTPFLGSTEFLYEPAIRWIGGTDSKVSISKSIACGCVYRKTCLSFQ